MESTSSQEPPKSTKTNGNRAMLIIIIIIAVFLVLVVGGYLSWKYFFKAKFTSSASSISANPTTTITKNPTAFTLTQLEDMIKYPNGTLTSTDHSKDSGYTSVLTMETDDSIITANNYYLSLNSSQKWTVTSKSLESDNSRADIIYEGTKDKFTAHLIIDHNYEKTDILVRIDAEDLPIGTPLGTETTIPAIVPTTTATPTTVSQTGLTPTNSYIIADSKTRIISESDISSFTPWQLKVARNEIYARYGRAFVHKDLQCYFNTQSWYKIDNNFTESVLSTIETKNIATIQTYEQKTNSLLQSFDSGCRN